MYATIALAAYVLAVLLSYKRKGPLDRWYLLPRTPWGRVFLHRMLLPDDRPEVHNHPWPCFSIVLWGGYREMRWSTATGSISTRSLVRGSINRLPLTAFHRIVDVKPNTWTLFFHGRRPAGREWGFATSKGFVPWDQMPAARGGRHGKRAS